MWQPVMEVNIVAQLLVLDPTLLKRQASWRQAARYGRDDVLNLMLS